MLSPGASVYDIGLTNRTEADGLAVPQASELAAQAMRALLAGVYTVADDTLFVDLHRVRDTEGLRIEPSAAAGFSGPGMLTGTDAGRAYLARKLDGAMPGHASWWDHRRPVRAPRGIRALPNAARRWPPERRLSESIVPNPSIASLRSLIMTRSPSRRPPSWHAAWPPAPRWRLPTPIRPSRSSW
jgi:hypothetical protein